MTIKFINWKIENMYSKIRVLMSQGLYEVKFIIINEFQYVKMGQTA